MKPPQSHLWPFLLILVAGGLSYANIFTVPFVLDDVSSILANPQIKSFVFSFKPRILGELSFAVNYHLHGLSLTGYHLASLVLHLANACLVYVFVIMVFKTPVFTDIAVESADRYTAIATALFFVAHPLQTGAVTYIAQRVTLLAAFFCLIAVIAYIRSRLSSGGESILLFIFSLMSAAAAIFSKENSAILPGIILLCELSFFKGNPLRRTEWLWYLLPPVLLLLLANRSLIFNTEMVKALLAMTAESGAPSRRDYLLSQFPVILGYMKLFLFPSGQNFDHDIAVRTSLRDPTVFLSLSLILSLVAVSVRSVISGRKSDGLSQRIILLTGFGVLWFFAAISLESGVIPLRDLMFEHRMYLPSVGLNVAVVTIIISAISGRAVYRNFPAVICCCVILLGGMTFSRNLVWQSEVSLWKDAASKSPLKGRTHGALGHALQRDNLLPEAEREYLEAIRLSPADHVAVNNLGAVYLHQKRFSDAIKQFNAALEISPVSAEPFFNLGLAYSAIGRMSEARYAFEQAVRLRPENSAARKHLQRLQSVRGP